MQGLVAIGIGRDGAVGVRFADINGYMALHLLQNDTITDRHTVTEEPTTYVRFGMVFNALMNLTTVLDLDQNGAATIWINAV